ncbi:MAG: J domain-containing protein [Limnothrix sp.]
MNLLHCYEILGLRVDAKLDTIKASYRRLARRYHPDINVGDQQAQEKFIQINQAYKILLQTFPELYKEESVVASPSKIVPDLSAHEHRLKWQSYRTLQQCLRQERYTRAIALTEGLASRLPDDAEVRQWQSIIYLTWGSKLISQGQQLKARTYLRKAFLADPQNRKLRQRIEQVMAKIMVPAV